MNEETRKPLSLPEVASLGVGTMIGAGIFALFGQISLLAGGYAWLAFVISGVVSGLAGYSYYVFSRYAKTNGGVAEYLALGWKSNLVGRVISLCYFLSIAIVLGLVAKAFAHYTTVVFSLSQGWVDWLGVGIMLAFLLVNAAGVKFVGVIEKLMVATKLIVLIGLTVVTFALFNAGTYAQNGGAVPFDFGRFINAVALANLLFAGFAVIANAGGSIKAGKNTIGRAIFIAIVIVALVYIALDVAVFGSIGIQKIEVAKDYALAEAARPALGAIGFVVLGVTAMISTMTNINANIFSGSNTIAFMAERKQLNPVLSRRIFLDQGNIAMFATVTIVIVLLLTMDISQIGDVASLTFLLVHTFIPLGALADARTRKGANTLLLWLATLANGGIMAFFIYHLLGRQDLELYVFAGVVVFAIIFCALSARLISQDEAPPMVGDIE